MLWSVGADMRRCPDGSMLYQWLASMPLSRARSIYCRLLEAFPLMMNYQVGALGFPLISGPLRAAFGCDAGTAQDLFLAGLAKCIELQDLGDSLRTIVASTAH